MNLDFVQDLFNFDKVLHLLYSDTNDSRIDPILYALKFCEQAKNEVDLYENTEMIDEKSYNPERYLKSINQIDEFERKCIENCRQNFDYFSERLKNIIESVLELSTQPQAKYTIDKINQIRNESIHVRKEIFNQNLIFLDKIGNKKIGSLILIEPFCLDDFQIECIK